MSEKKRTSAGQNGANGHKADGLGDSTEYITAPVPTAASSTPEQVNGNRHSSGNGNGTSHSNGHSNGIIKSDGNQAVRVASVRPVKARLSNGYDRYTGNGNGDVSGNGTGKLNGNGHHDTTPHAVLDGDGDEKARVTRQDTRELPTISTTSRLRESDLAGLRLRLKAEEWPIAASRRNAKTNRKLPYFMMRHRSLRARSRVGHTRALVATRRYGNSGGATLIIRLLIVVFVLGFLTSAAGIGAGIGGAAYYIGKLPPVDPDHLAAAIAQNGVLAQTTKIYDRNGNLLYDFVDEDTGQREELPLSKMSPWVISATVAAEDANFFTNPGVDFYALLRAVRINLSGTGTSGASTITQQLARNIFMTPEERTAPTFSRKVKEAVLAVELTQTYSKDDILSLYLNQTYYGHRAYGVGGAALTYFGKEAKDLTLPEAALLAGLPQSPTEYDPFVNPTDAKTRQTYVLDQMAKQGMITDAQAADAEAQVVDIRPYNVKIQAPHFVYYVKQYIEQKYGSDASEAGLKVYTSLDLNVQNEAQKVASDRIDQLKQQKATNAAIVIMKPGTGEILAMLGSVNYYDTTIDGQVNVATSERQPGSSFKPITYVTAFEHGWSPGTVILDSLTGFPNAGQPDYVPKNYDGKDHGWVTAREALGNSLNIPAVKTLQFAGIQNTIDNAHAMGIKGLNRGLDWYGLSLTLGGGEVTLLDMTNAYSTFANQGTEVDANPILEIVDSQNRVINCNAAYTCSPNSAPVQQKQFGDGNGQVIDPRYAYMITNILSDNNARTMEFGPNSALKVSFPAAVKTGTTNDNRDSWTLGYTPDLTIGVWVGNSNNAEMLAVTGALGAAVIWHNVMEDFYSNPSFVNLIRHPDGTTQKNFVQPPGLVKASACSAAGEITDLFIAGQVPKGCTTYKDPKQDKALHGVPSSNKPSQPQAPSRPTPLPGIIYPTPRP